MPTRLTVALAFDHDALSSPVDCGEGPVIRSRGEFGPRVGVPRILDLLSRHDRDPRAAHRARGGPRRGRLRSARRDRGTLGHVGARRGGLNHARCRDGRSSTRSTATDPPPDLRPARGGGARPRFGRAPGRETYVALIGPRRTFAPIQATTRSRVDVGLHLAGVEPDGRAVPTKSIGQSSMTHKIGFASVDEVDAEALGWLRRADDTNA